MDTLGGGYLGVASDADMDLAGKSLEDGCCVEDRSVIGQIMRTVDGQTMYVFSSREPPSIEITIRSTTQATHWHTDRDESSPIVTGNLKRFRLNVVVILDIGV